MKFLENLNNKKATRYLWIAVAIFGLGVLLSIYFEVWIAVGILGVLIVESGIGIYLLRRLRKQPQVDESIQVTEAFGDTLVREVMVPRTDMVTVDSSFSVEASLDLMLFNGFSRLPVYEESIDDIKGIAYAKDLMSAVRDKQGDQLVSEKIRSANFVPETKRISSLLQEMQASSFHVAIAIDEYGGTAGIVTLEDLIEEIVGEITDEFDMEKPLMERLGEDEFMINGRVSISDLADTLGVKIPEGNWSTVGGFIVSTLGHIPEVNEEISMDGYLFLVEQVQGRRIARVRISPLSQNGVVDEVE